MLKSHAALARREVRTLVECDSHPNVLRLFLHETHGPFVYLALEAAVMTLAQWMELTHIDGSSLASEGGASASVFTDDSRDTAAQPQPVCASITADNASDPRPARDGLALLAQTVRGLAHLHQHGLSHGDLKPSNILLSASGVAKLSDFGFASSIHTGLSSTLSRVSSTASLGFGSRGWCAPEMLRPLLAVERSRMWHGRGGIAALGDPSTGEGASPSSDPSAQASGDSRPADIFSLGCLVHAALCGSHPFLGGPIEIELNIARGERPPLCLPRACASSTVARGRVADFYSLMHLMLASAAEERPTAAQVLRHPLFWSASSRLRLFLDTSDAIEVLASTQPARTDAMDGQPPPSVTVAAQLGATRLTTRDVAVSSALRRFQTEVERLGWLPWTERLPAPLVSEGSRRRGYSSSSARALLRLIRNTWHHLADLPPPLRLLLSRQPELYAQFWCSRFPELTVLVRRLTEEMGLQVEGELPPDCDYEAEAAEARAKAEAEDAKQGTALAIPVPSPSILEKRRPRVDLYKQEDVIQTMEGMAPHQPAVQPQNTDDANGRVSGAAKALTAAGESQPIVDAPPNLQWTAQIVAPPARCGAEPGRLGDAVKAKPLVDAAAATFSTIDGDEGDCGRLRQREEPQSTSHLRLCGLPSAHGAASVVSATQLAARRASTANGPFTDAPPPSSSTCADEPGYIEPTRPLVECSAAVLSTNNASCSTITKISQTTTSDGKALQPAVSSCSGSAGDVAPSTSTSFAVPIVDTRTTAASATARGVAPRAKEKRPDGAGASATIRVELCRTLFGNADAELAAHDRSAYCTEGEPKDAQSTCGQPESADDVAGSAESPITACAGARCNFAHSVTELVATRGRRKPTASHVADQMAQWLYEAASGGPNGGGSALLATPRTAEGFKQLYKSFCQARNHVAPPMWRPVMIMMARHRLLVDVKPKAKSQDGWDWGPLLVAVVSPQLLSTSAKELSSGGGGARVEDGADGSPEESPLPAGTATERAESAMEFPDGSLAMTPMGHTRCDTGRLEPSAQNDPSAEGDTLGPSTQNDPSTEGDSPPCAGCQQLLLGDVVEMCATPTAETGPTDAHARSVGNRQS